MIELQVADIRIFNILTSRRARNLPNMGFPGRRMSAEAGQWSVAESSPMLPPASSSSSLTLR